MHINIYVKDIHLVVQVCPLVCSGSLCYEGEAVVLWTTITIYSFSKSYRASWYCQRFYTSWCTGFL